MQLSNHLRASVLFCCEGGYPARFLNAAAQDGIALWDVRFQQNRLTCRAFAADYVRLRRAARHGQVCMRLQQRRGLPFHLRRFRRRSGLVAGAVLFALLLSFLSSRTWVIRIVGNHTVSDGEILSILKPLGIAEGGVFSEVELNHLQLTALQQLPNVTWLTVNRSGSIVTVELQETTPQEPISDTAPANLVAVRDGVVVQITAVCGQPVVRAGDAVRQGDLLISGVMNSSTGPQLKHADGHVLARTTHTISITVPLHETITRQAKAEPDRLSLMLFGIRIPLYTDTAPDGSAHATTRQARWTVNDVPLPVGLCVTSYGTDVTEYLTRTEQEAELLAKQRLAEAEADLQETLAIEERTLQREITADGVTLTAVYVGTQELSVSVLIE